MMAVLIADVDNPNADLPGDNVYRQIHEAVEAASPGDRINVRPGTYEPFRVWKNDLTIRSNSRFPKPVVHVDQRADVGIVVNASGVTIKGLSVQLDPPPPSPGPQIRPDTGFFVSGANNKLLENHVDGTFFAAIRLSNSGPNKTGNEFINNVVEGEGFYAFDIDNAAHSSLKRNSIHGDIYFGYHIIRSENLEIQNNIAKRTGVGFFSVDSHQNTYTKNTVREAQAGFVLIKSNMNHISHNTVWSSSNGGFAFDDSSSNVIHGNLARNNQRDGFLFNNGSNGNMLQGNLSFNNGGHGFHLQDNSENMLVRNLAFGNNGAGFVLKASSGVYARGNQAISNGGSGFEIRTSSTENLFANNCALLNEGWDYLVDSALDEDLDHNRC